jgi:hypothetical protein
VVTTIAASFVADFPPAFSPAFGFEFAFPQPPAITAASRTQPAKRAGQILRVGNEKDMN